MKLIRIAPSKDKLTLDSSFFYYYFKKLKNIYIFIYFAIVIWIFVYFTNKYVEKYWIQLSMFFGSLICGSCLIYIVNKSSYFGVMRRCPPLATLWVYFVMQLKLIPSVLSLIMVFLYFKFGDPNFKL